MDFYKYICSGEQFRDRANRIPKWAREEHLEMNVPQKELWNYLEDEPKSSGPRMTGIYRLVVVFLFAGSTFLIADDHFFLGHTSGARQGGTTPQAGYSADKPWRAHRPRLKLRLWRGWRRHILRW